MLRGFGKTLPLMNPPANTERRFTLRNFAVALAALLVFWFWRIFFAGESFVYRDFGYFGYPLAVYHHDAFWQGQLPLWNPYSHCGLPFLAQWNTMALYPGSLLYLLGPPDIMVSLFTIAHLWLAGVGMFLLARNWYANPVAAAFAGFGFAISGLGLNFVLWPNNVAALAWMPFLILNGLEATSRRAFVRAAVVGSLQMLTGAPEMILLTWVLLGALALARCWEEKSLRLPINLLLLGIVIACVCAAQLWPFLDLTRISQRHRDFGNSTWSMPIWGWASFLAPKFFTYVLSSDVRFQYEQLWTSSYYLAIPVTLFGVIASCRWRLQNPRERALIVLGLISILLALGPEAQVYTFFKSIIPGLGLIRFPIKFVVLTMFILPLLAASVLARDGELLRNGALQKRAMGILATLIVGVVLYAKVYPKYEPPYDNWPLTLASGALALAVAFLAFQALKSRHELAPLALVALIPFEIFLQVGNPAPGIMRAALAKSIPVPREGTGGRVFVTREAWETLYNTTLPDTLTNFVVNRKAINANLNLIDRQAKVDGFFSLNMAETERLRLQLYAKGQQNIGPLLDFMNVCFISDHGDISRLDVRSNAMPLVTAGQSPRSLKKTDFPGVLFDVRFDPRKMVLFDVPMPGYDTNAVEVTAVPYVATEHRITANIVASGPTFAVVSESFHPNWRARVNGQPAEVLRANFAFMAVKVPAGRSEVEWIYDDRAFKMGMWISMASAMSLFAFAAIRPT